MYKSYIPDFNANNFIDRISEDSPRLGDKQMNVRVRQDIRTLTCYFAGVA